MITTIRGDIKDQDTDRSKERDTGLGQKERFSHFLLSRLGLSKGRVRVELGLGVGLGLGLGVGVGLKMTP